MECICAMLVYRPGGALIDETCALAGRCDPGSSVQAIRRGRPAKPMSTEGEVMSARELAFEDLIVAVVDAMGQYADARVPG